VESRARAAALRLQGGLAFLRLFRRLAFAFGQVVFRRLHLHGAIRATERMLRRGGAGSRKQQPNCRAGGNGRTPCTGATPKRLKRRRSRHQSCLDDRSAGSN